MQLFDCTKVERLRSKEHRSKHNQHSLINDMLGLDEMFQLYEMDEVIGHLRPDETRRSMR